MPRYVLLAPRPNATAEDLELIEATPELEILDRMVPRALLVESSPEAIERLRALLPNWTLAEEVSYPRPAPRRERVDE